MRAVRAGGHGLAGRALLHALGAVALCFSRMMRYVLDTQRGANDRVRLGDELDFVRDYLALQALRRGRACA